MQANHEPLKDDKIQIDLFFTLRTEIRRAVVQSGQNPRGFGSGCEQHPRGTGWGRGDGRCPGEARAPGSLPGMATVRAGDMGVDRHWGQERL